MCEDMMCVPGCLSKCVLLYSSVVESFAFAPFLPSAVPGLAAVSLSSSSRLVAVEYRSVPNSLPRLRSDSRSFASADDRDDAEPRPFCWPGDESRGFLIELLLGGREVGDSFRPLFPALTEAGGLLVGVGDLLAFSTSGDSRDVELEDCTWSMRRDRGDRFGGGARGETGRLVPRETGRLPPRDAERGVVARLELALFCRGGSLRVSSFAFARALRMAAALKVVLSPFDGLVSELSPPPLPPALGRGLRWRDILPRGVVGERGVFALGPGPPPPPPPPAPPPYAMDRTDMGELRGG